MKKTKRRLRSLAGIIASLILTGTADAGKGPAAYLDRPDSWFSGAEAKTIASHILSYQSPLGGWPKNVDTAKERAKSGAPLPPTFDNRATMNELRFLARSYGATHDETYRSAFERGLIYILKAQYPTGGWPQSYPPDGQYHRYITFNDDAMVNLMNFIREVATDECYAFVKAEQRVEARQKFDRGVECILKCQISVNGKLTVWCAQHDELDYRPRPARAFELASLSGSESVGIVRLLMSLNHPDAKTVAAVKSAVAWFEAAKITGHQVVEVADEKSPKGKDRRLVETANAEPLWARFYEIESNRPFFCDRDGVVKYQLSEIGYERRNGYAWFGNWPQKLVEKEYPAWLRRLAGS